MATDWRTIPGNEHAFQRLCDLMRSEKTPLSFVGAGASAELYPLWTGLIDRLADEAVKRGRADNATRDSWRLAAEKLPDQPVRGIKAALGDGIYANALRDIFRPRAGAGGNRYTALQGLLVSLPFRGHVTTNFDPGLIEARMRLRQDSLSTGFGTWKDADIVEGWTTGDIFAAQPCPILFAHGYYERTDSVVLGTAEYRDIYKTGAFRRLFLKLFEQENLVFVGLSFNDDWIRFVANEVLTVRRSSDPRHIALIPMPDGHVYTPFDRDMFVNQYDAEPLFFPVTTNPNGTSNYGALLAILRALGFALGVPPPATPAPPAAVAAVPTHPACPHHPARHLRRPGCPLEPRNHRGRPFYRPRRRPRAA